MNTKPCTICNEPNTPYQIDGKNCFCDCPNCGRYHKSLSFEGKFYEDRRNEFYKISSYIKEQNKQFNNFPIINIKKFEEILNIRDKRIKEKFDLLLMFLEKLSGKIRFMKDYNIVMSNIGELDERISQLCKDVLTECWIKDYKELGQLFNKAIERNLILGEVELSGACVFSELTFDGIEYIESLENINQNSKNIFAAFNFEDNLQDVFNTHLKTAIESEGFNYVVVNQDNVDHNKSINDEIIVKLKSSRIVIADFTNHRNSVYFEAGYAMGMNIPIIWTCQEGHEDDMSFDTRQFPHIIWKDKDDLVKQVIDRIKVIL